MASIHASSRVQPPRGTLRVLRRWLIGSNDPKRLIVNQIVLCEGIQVLQVVPIAIGPLYPSDEDVQNIITLITVCILSTISFSYCYELMSKANRLRPADTIGKNYLGVFLAREARLPRHHVLALLPNGLLLVDLLNFLSQDTMIQIQKRIMHVMSLLSLFSILHCRLNIH